MNYPTPEFIADLRRVYDTATPPIQRQIFQTRKAMKRGTPSDLPPQFAYNLKKFRKALVTV